MTARICARTGCDRSLEGRHPKARYCSPEHRIAQWKETHPESVQNGGERRGTGRTYWWKKDAAWWDRSRVARLAMKYGPLGPAVLDWLSCHAKTLNDAGEVKSGYTAIAKGTCALVAETGSHWTPENVVGPVVAYAVQIGALDDYVQLDDDRFTCRISGWAEDQDEPHERIVPSFPLEREGEEDGEKLPLSPTSLSVARASTLEENE